MIIFFLALLLFIPTSMHAEDVVISPPLEAKPIDPGLLKIVPVNADNVILPNDLGDIDHYAAPLDKGLMLVGYPSMKESQERLSPNGAFSDKLELRTPNSLTWDYLDGNHVTQIFVRPQWIQKKGVWYDLEYAVVEDVQYMRAKNKLGWWNKFLTPTYAASFSTNTLNDWQIGRSGIIESWNSTVTGTGTIQFAGPSLAGVYAYAEASNGIGNTIYRSSYPFDTSALPSNAVISDARFGFKCSSKFDTDGNGEINVFQQTIANITNPGITSYQNNFTSTTTGATAMTVASIVCANYNEIVFNATGRSWVKRSGEAGVCGGGTAGLTCLSIRVNSDYANIPPSNNSTEGVKMTANNSTAPPYLSVTYSLPATSTTSTASEASLAAFTNSYYTAIVKVAAGFLFMGLLVGIFEVFAFVKRSTSSRL